LFADSSPAAAVTAGAAGVVVPPRFRPRDSQGLALKGPLTTRNGEAHNLGRQFFSTFKDAAGGFLWADGTEAFR
jgi:hypothetical protein